MPAFYVKSVAPSPKQRKATVRTITECDCGQGYRVVFKKANQHQEAVRVVEVTRLVEAARSARMAAEEVPLPLKYTASFKDGDSKTYYVFM